MKLIFPAGVQSKCLIGSFRDISFDHTDQTAAPTCTSDFFIPEVQLSSAVTDFLCADCYPLQNYGYTYCDLLKAQTKTQRDWKQKPGYFGGGICRSTQKKVIWVSDYTFSELCVVRALKSNSSDNFLAKFQGPVQWGLEI